MATIAIIIDHSSIFAHRLLLVSVAEVRAIKKGVSGTIERFLIKTEHNIYSFLIESPRWLISKGREKKAYKILFNKKYDMDYYTGKEINKQKEAEQNAKATTPLPSKWQNIFKELSALYGPPRLRRMALICHFTWCVTALSYYVTGNFSTSRPW